MEVLWILLKQKISMLQLQGTYKEIISISIPIFFSSLAWNVISLTDNAFLGKVGKVELGAIAIASIFYVCLLTLVMGFSRAFQIIVSRKLGEQKPTEVGAIFNQIFFTSAIIFVLMGAVSWFTTSFILQATLSSNAVATACSTFIKYRSISLPFEIVATMLAAFFNGIGRNKIIITHSIVIIILNILFNYFLVFGNFGFPMMGIAGSGLASALSCIIGFFILFFNVLRTKFVAMFGLFTSFKINWVLQKELFLFSIPLVGQLIIALISWLAFFILIENMGEHELAVSNLMKGIYMFFCIPIWALNSTTNTLISNFNGQKKGALMFVVLNKILVISLALMSICGVVFYVFNAYFFGLFTNDTSLISDANELLPIVLFCFIAFPISTTYFNSIVALEDGKASILIELVNVAVYLLFLFYVAKSMHASLFTVWCAEFFYWTSLGFCCLIYFKVYKRHKKFYL